jgi:HSP20 family protein
MGKTTWTLKVPREGAMEEGRARRFQGFLDMASELNRIRQLGIYGYEPGWEDRERNHANAWVPDADVYAKDEDLVIRLALAGVRREAVEITLHDNVLTVSGERDRDLDEEEVTFYVNELYYGVFRRSMTLPSGIDESKISAEFYNGLMEITVRGAAAAAAEPRRIEIRERSD